MSFQSGSAWFRRQAAPVTIAILATAIVSALIWWFARMEGIERVALSPAWQSQPWTLVTYPWANVPIVSGLSILCFVFLVMWVFSTGSTIERDLGPTRTILLWTVMILLPGLFIALIGSLVAKSFLVFGFWLPVAGTTIVWCTRNQSAQVNLYGILPVSGKWLGYITLIATVLLSGVGNPMLGVVSALHLPIAYLFAANKIPFWTYSGAPYAGRGRPNPDRLKKTERMDNKYYDDVRKREKERDERERLRKLFESSVRDSDKDE